MTLQPSCILVHYGEIAIKGKNRPWFEKLLIDQIKKALQKQTYGGIEKLYGRIVLQLGPDSNIEHITKALGNVFGISNICIAYETGFTLEAIQKIVVGIMPADATTVRVFTKRADKGFPLSSMEMNATLGSSLIKERGLTIDLVDAATTVWVEIANRRAFVYIHKMDGLRGLPVGASGKVIVMLSGGIDSPVAAYLAMKRGCKPVFVHFHSVPQTNPASKDKVVQLAKLLAPYHQGAKLYLVPFLAIQRLMMTDATKKLRVVLYRRAMLRIAEMLAVKEHAKAFVTGDSIGQVASQTIDNLGVIQESVKFLILRPLLCYDKQEIIHLAEKIGTYETSIQPHEDCCTVFVPKHPATEAKLEQVVAEEKKLTLGDAMRDAVKQAEVVTLEPC